MQMAFASHVSTGQAALGEDVDTVERPSRISRGARSRWGRARVTVGARVRGVVGLPVPREGLAVAPIAQTSGWWVW